MGISRMTSEPPISHTKESTVVLLGLASLQVADALPSLPGVCRLGDGGALLCGLQQP